MDWGALGSRDAVLAICEHFGIDFAQARDHLLARQLQQAEERAAAAEEEEEEEEERRKNYSKPGGAGEIGGAGVCLFIPHTQEEVV